MKKAHNLFVWEIKKGDLVKIKEYPTGSEDKCVFLKGVVVSNIKHRNQQQQPMWPSVDVYVFTGTIRECMPGNVEVISVS